MQRGREPQLLLERIFNKGTKGLEEFEEYIKKLVAESLKESIIQEEKGMPTLRQAELDNQIEQIIVFLIGRARLTTNGELQRTLLVQSLQSIAFELEEPRLVKKYFSRITLCILRYFEDTSEKVRLSSIGSMYNLLNKYSQVGLELFLQTFEAVAGLMGDGSGQVRQAATFLNQTLKTLINDAVFDSQPFDLRAFIELLADKFQSGNAVFKQFLLDWLMAIEQIPHFQLSFDLPLFFKQVFELLLSNSKNLRTKAEECLKKFLHVFRQILALKGRLGSKLRADSAQMLVSMTLIMVRQNLSTQTTLHALQWLQVFTRFFSLQVSEKDEPFIEPIYASHFRDIILVIITTLSDDCDRIRRISHRINEALLSAFPVMKKDEKKLNDTSTLLSKLLQENKLPVRVEAILKWIKLLLQENSERMLANINLLIQYLVERLCDRQATRNLFLLLEGSLFLEEYFELLVQTLLSFLFQNELIPPEPIFRQLLTLQNSHRNFTLICKRVRLFQHPRFQYRLIECLISILVTENSLEGLRTRLQAEGEQRKSEDFGQRRMSIESPEEHWAIRQSVDLQAGQELLGSLFRQLFACFSRNEAAVLILCFLGRKYLLITKFMKLLAYTERITGQKYRSLIKISNLIENSNMNHLRADLRHSSIALKAYLSLLMALPHGKYYNLLLQRLPPHPQPYPNENISMIEEQQAEQLLRDYQISLQQQQEEEKVL